MKLSILIPVFNEERTVRDILTLILGININKELIIVDDCSYDKTRDILKEYFSDNPQIKIIYHQKNLGKGEAIRTALEAATGDICIVQDADLEYSPNDYPKLMQPLEQGDCDAVYGSRFLLSRKSTALWHFLVNKFLTVLGNILFGCRLTDMETCYKMIKTDIFRKLNIESQRFEIDVEITAKLVKNGYKICEVPVSYKGRSYHEGKKITWRDGISSVIALFKYKFTN